MFRSHPMGDRKALDIYDDASDIRLTLDTDDVNPDDVSETNVKRIVDGLNREFYWEFFAQV